MPIIRDVRLLHPQLRRAASEMQKSLTRKYEAGLTKTNFQIFETFRSPGRQMDLLSKGATKAGAYASAHQFGLAVDFVPHLSASEAEALAEKIGERVLPGWNWHSSNDYKTLAVTALDHGLVVPIAWDMVHVEHPKWREFQRKFKETFPY